MEVDVGVEVSQAITLTFEVNAHRTKNTRHREHVVDMPQTLNNGFGWQAIHGEPNFLQATRVDVNFSHAVAQIDQRCGLCKARAHRPSSNSLDHHVAHDEKFIKG